MKHVVAILMLLILVVGCAPSGNTATSQPPTPVTVDKNTQVPAVDTRVSALENELANCQSTNIKLQKQIDQSASAGNTPSIKEPASGDYGSYNMNSDKPGLQYPNKYLTWDIALMSCGAYERCMLSTALTNNHPNLTITDVTINGVSIGTEESIVTINPGQTFKGTKSLPMPKVVDYQVILRWVWK